MFIGHFAVGFASKRFAPRSSLAVLIAAPLFSDLLWPVFLLLGWERVRIDPGNTRFTPLDLEYYPWSHSLLMTVAWATASSLAYYAISRYRQGAFVVWIGVFSHWVLDYVSHRPDMPLYPAGGPKLGLVLWNSIAGTMIVELLMFAAGVWLYSSVTRPRDRIGRYSCVAYVLLLLLLYVGDRFSPPPPGVADIAWSGIIAMVFFFPGRGGSIIIAPCASPHLQPAQLARYDAEPVTPLKGFLLFFLAASVFAQTKPNTDLDAVFPAARAFYLETHEHPELSGHELRTAENLAAHLRRAGYEVTEHVGGNGVVAILKNGAGPTIMLRTELDALPVEEKTGLPYASKVRAKDDAGRDVPVMHACGHDLHMAALLGTAEIMAKEKSGWHGTLMLVGQPAEETIVGAGIMIGDGLFTRFPRPDVAVALHVGNELPAGMVAITPGIYNTNADSVRITIYGKGGHGAMPEATIDPIVIAARTILDLQTIVSREVKPGEMAILTIGYVRAGTKNNIIPDQAEMGLTVRTFKSAVRQQILAAIARIANSDAAAAGAPREPLIEHYEGTDLVYNNPALAERLRPPLEAALGKENVVTAEPITPSEDFSKFLQAGTLGFYFTLGGADPEKFAQAKRRGEMLPSNHSPHFAPDADPALRTGITAEVAVLKNLLNSSPEDFHRLAASQVVP